LKFWDFIQNLITHENTKKWNPNRPFVAILSRNSIICYNFCIFGPPFMINLEFIHGKKCVYQISFKNKHFS